MQLLGEALVPYNGVFLGAEQDAPAAWFDWSQSLYGSMQDFRIFPYALRASDLSGRLA